MKDQQLQKSGNQQLLPPKTSIILGLFALCFLTFFAWAWHFRIDEVSTGTGKIVPSSKEQVIQSLDGGILMNIKVKEGDIVAPGQTLAQLDLTRAESIVAEGTSRLQAAQATAARLGAEVSGLPLKFPRSVIKNADLVYQETALYKSRRTNLEESIAGYKEALFLVEQELKITEPLVAKGAVSKVQILRLKRDQNNLQNKLNDTRNQYLVQARESLAKANAEIEMQRSAVRGKFDSVARSTFNSPVHGIVKDLEITTIGGVIPPNGKLMTIVPLDKNLVVETRVAPRDIAFIHPEQEALVKITAYDYSIYGGLKGRVITVSPDTIQDEVRRDVYYYRVYIRTDSNYLVNKTGDKFPIVPGMIASVDIHTGSKTIADYLLTPLNRIREALRER
ncbi:Type I secretion system membrane fusion protein PrsE [Legionella massiliensis]|uniref:Type I secretion system membrane fusion protein PrsE n=1 Tax=Legionella massiliensis TaxID=1034943 RepID=A0A078KW93_9GAMM|nr:HlyD family efflux transporter periplasmic adaptor subunit [Legionella massiliensis]CDZ76024.1 Type I secretion system membrane fusion protein PrsE [Legionella massiliensis]CEE11762.1 Type I secretion system membrane fusion protein PrsE [Legionella massiliensis]